MDTLALIKKYWLSAFWIIVWLISTTYALLFGLTNFKVTETYRLVKKGIETDAVITDKLRQDHQRIQYSFQVAGEKYSYGGFAGDLGKDFDQVSIGEKVKITYEPDNPNNSCLGNCENSFYSELRFVIFLSLIPTIALILLRLSYFFKPPK